MSHELAARGGGLVAAAHLVDVAGNAEPAAAQVVWGVCPVADHPFVVTDGAPPSDRRRRLGPHDGDGHPPRAAPVGRSAPTRQRRHPRITNLAGGARPDNISQMLRQAPRGTRSVVRHVEEVTQISDQHAATLYRRTATAFLPTDRRWLCLRS